MAVLFALDRRAAAPALRAALASHDVVLVDRYVASNAAYGAARLHEDAAGEFVGLGPRAGGRALRHPRPRPPAPPGRVRAEVAAARAAHRERTEADRARDAYESDDGLQKRTGEVYAELAAAAWLSPWTVLDGTTDPGGPGRPDTRLSRVSGWR